MFDPNSASGLLLQAAGAAAGLTGTWLVNHRNRAGYACWLVSNTVSMVFQTLIGAWLLASLNVAYLVLAIQGIRLHRKKSSSTGQSTRSLDKRALLDSTVASN